MSHLGSQGMYETLASHSRIHGYRTGLVYDHPDSLVSLFGNIHKSDNSAAVFMDELLYNYSMSALAIRTWAKDYCKFVFYLESPSSCLGRLRRLLPNGSAERYYCSRLHGLYEYSMRVPDAVVATSTDDSTLQRINQYLDLTERLVRGEKEIEETTASTECQECFERYVALMTSSSKS
jgi:hypothetical protein